MPKVALTGGAYQARSVIASAQRSLNLLAEPLPEQQGEPSRFAHYPTPGTTLLGTLPKNRVRAVRQATNGAIYAVAGNTVYLVDTSSLPWTGSALGDISIGRTTPVSMVDNGTSMFIVDGSTSGWTIDLASHAFAAVTDAEFTGADAVGYLDTFFIFNKPGTPQFYWSLSNSTSFDPLALDFANKASFSDLLVTIAVAKREIWLLGERTSEIFFNAGAPDSQFQQQPGVFIDHGCAAKYSVATYDNAVYWLTYGRGGERFVVAGAGYEPTRVSTYAIENQFALYARIDDAIGFTFSQNGHAFYVVTFPSADATWVYDITTQQWHEWKWIDSNGDEHRHRANCCYAINNQIVVGDWENGNLYHVDPTVFTDNGQPIKRVRAYPHLLNEGSRVFYRQFLADMETGNPAGAPVGTLNTLVSCSFTAPDGTLLEDYSNPNDTNATWTLVSGVGGEIEGDQFIGPVGSASVYHNATLSTPDYTLQFRAIPTVYDSVGTATIYAVARTTGAGTGYVVGVSGDGLQYVLGLEAATGTPALSLDMGTLMSGWFIITMTLQGTLITVTAQRNQDGLWLQSSGLWTAAAVPALTLTDSTYTAAGFVMIGGSW